MRADELYPTDYWVTNMPYCPLYNLLTPKEDTNFFLLAGGSYFPEFDRYSELSAQFDRVPYWNNPYLPLPEWIDTSKIILLSCELESERTEMYSYHMNIHNQTKKWVVNEWRVSEGYASFKVLDLVKGGNTLMLIKRNLATNKIEVVIKGDKALETFYTVRIPLDNLLGTSYPISLLPQKTLWNEL